MRWDISEIYYNQTDIIIIICTKVGIKDENGNDSKKNIFLRSYSRVGGSQPKINTTLLTTSIHSSYTEKTTTDSVCGAQQ